MALEIPYSRTERKSQQMHQSKDMIGETCCIGVMPPNFQVAFVVQQTIEYMG